MGKSSKTKYVILGLLSNKPLSGYDIKKEIDKHLVHMWAESYGQIYPSLNELEQQCLVKKTIEVSNKGVAKNQYEITDAGLLELKKWLRLPPEKDKRKSEALLKIFFGANLSVEETIQQFIDYRNEKLDELAAFEQIVNYSHKSNSKNITNDTYTYLIFQYAIHLHHAVIEWADEGIQLLKNLDDKS